MGTVKFSEHPDYQINMAKWETYRDLYDGDHATLTSVKYLWPHEIEGSRQEAGRAPDGTPWTVGEKLRGIRAQRSRYLNLFEPIVSNWTSLAFSRPIQISAKVREMLGEEINNIDGEGNSLENFIKTILAPAYFRDGKPIVLVDAPSVQFRTIAEQKQAGFRPYIELLDVLSVKDWQVDERGNLAWIRYEYYAIPPRLSPTETPQKTLYSKVLIIAEEGYTQEVYKKDGENWELVEVVPISGWGTLPISLIIMSHGLKT
jgi:hypothetical protein